MSETMCICCGKQPGASPEMAAMANKGLPEKMFEKMRETVPQELYERMRDVMLNAPPLRVGFCTYCNRAGCDGTSSCKVPPVDWEMMKQAETERAAWDAARGMSIFEFGEPGTRKTLLESTLEEWVQLSDNYRRRLMRTPETAMLCEILRIDTLAVYQTEVTVLETSNPDHEGQALGMLNAESLEEAEQHCERAIKEILEGAVPGGGDFIIWHSGMEEDA